MQAQKAGSPCHYASIWLTIFCLFRSPGRVVLEIIDFYSHCLNNRLINNSNRAYNFYFKQLHFLFHFLQSMLTHYCPVKRTSLMLIKLNIVFICTEVLITLLFFWIMGTQASNKGSFAIVKSYPWLHGICSCQQDSKQFAIQSSEVIHKMISQVWLTID